MQIGNIYLIDVKGTRAPNPIRVLEDVRRRTSGSTYSVAVFEDPATGALARYAELPKRFYDRVEAVEMGEDFATFEDDSRDGYVKTGAKLVDTKGGAPHDKEVVKTAKYVQDRTAKTATFPITLTDGDTSHLVITLERLKSGKTKLSVNLRKTVAAKVDFGIREIEDDEGEDDGGLF